MTPNESQLTQIRNHFKKYKSITSWTAISKYHITRLSQYILLLREEGMDIEMKRIQQEGSKWFGLYTLKN